MSQVYPFDRRNLWGQLNAHNPIYCLKINIKTDYIVGTLSADYTRQALPYSSRSCTLFNS